MIQSEIIEASLLTGGIDKPYAYGLAMGLSSSGVHLDIIGGDEIYSPEMQAEPQRRFLNYYGNPRECFGLARRIDRILRMYVRLVYYAARSSPRIFHILWNNKFQYFDRTALMLFYKLMGKRIVLTAHNVNAGKRDANDSIFNRFTLKIQYKLADHIFVHTNQMKRELLKEFGISDSAATVIRFGINNSVPNTDINAAQAKQIFGLKKEEKTILFFGAIRPYKGIEYLLEAFEGIQGNKEDYRLIIAGEPKKGSEKYLEKIQQLMDQSQRADKIIKRLAFIPDNETEFYFKAADVLVLPYTEIFQSGVLLLSYSFGLPVIAADVGSFSEDIISGKLGFLYNRGSVADLSKTIEGYFSSDLYKCLEDRRLEISEYANSLYSWDGVCATTGEIYKKLLNN
jgi:glycosyltransferase involved in cell wall biosynthesis